MSAWPSDLRGTHQFGHLKRGDMRVVVLGGYGNFGARICRALAGDAGIELVVAGRDEARGAVFAKTLKGNVEAVALDASASDFARCLERLKPV
jgi:saccharopine dehydrogenase-like NADP-dependent oxidoreductase